MTLSDVLRKASGCTRKRCPWTHVRLRYSRLIRRISVAGGRRKGISQRKTSSNSTADAGPRCVGVTKSANAEAIRLDPKFNPLKEFLQSASRSLAASPGINLLDTGQRGVKP